MRIKMVMSTIGYSESDIFFLHLVNKFFENKLESKQLISLAQFIEAYNFDRFDLFDFCMHVGDEFNLKYTDYYKDLITTIITKFSERKFEK